MVCGGVCGCTAALATTTLVIYRHDAAGDVRTATLGARRHFRSPVVVFDVVVIVIITQVTTSEMALVLCRIVMKVIVKMGV